jgi:hypothetical protein
MKTPTHNTDGLAAHTAASRSRAVAPACAMPWYGNAEKRFVGFVSTDHTTRTRRPEGVPR